MLHPQTVRMIWKIFGKAEVSFQLQRQLSPPNLLFEGQGRVGSRLAQPPPLCIPPDCPDSTGHQAIREQGHKVLLVLHIGSTFPLY